MFNRQKIDPRIVVAQMSSLSIAWGIAAGVAYLGLIKRAIDVVAAATPWTGANVDSGLISLNAERSTRLAGSFGSIVGPVVVALPFAIVAVIALGILIRARPRLASSAGVALIVAALLGIIGAFLLFLAQVATRERGTEFIVALVTIVIVAVLLRLQRFVRRFYSRSPAFATLFFGVFTIVYLILANGVNISSIVLSQVDVWLGIISFAIALYAGFKLVNAARKAR